MWGPLCPHKKKKSWAGGKTIFKQVIFKQRTYCNLSKCLFCQESYSFVNDSICLIAMTWVHDEMSSSRIYARGTDQRAEESVA